MTGALSPGSRINLDILRYLGVMRVTLLLS